MYLTAPVARSVVEESAVSVPRIEACPCASEKGLHGRRSRRDSAREREDLLLDEVQLLLCDGV